MKNIKKFLCAALAAIMTITILPAYSANAATYAELQAKRKNLAASTSNAKKEIEKLVDYVEKKYIYVDCGVVETDSEIYHLILSFEYFHL